MIEDFSVSFYAASLVPAANVHFSAADSSMHEGPYLRPEVMAREGTPPEARGMANRQQAQRGQAQVCPRVLMAGCGYLHFALSHRYGVP